MKLAPAQARALLERFGVYALSACDKCGQLLGPVRYTRKGEAGIWCSSDCRGDVERPVIHRGGRPRKYESDADKQRAYRHRVLGVTKPVSRPMEAKDLQVQKRPLSYHPLTQPLSAQKQPACESGGGSV
jgi:hypothetical protein